jgi:hypothetical protein
MQANWQNLTPLAIRNWVRTTLPIAGDEYVAAELEKLSEKFNSIGLADPTRSDLVQDDFAAHWNLQPPRGYDAEHVKLWRKLPYRLAKWVAEKRLQDMKAVRKCQNLEAFVKQRRESERAARG